MKWLWEQMQNSVKNEKMQQNLFLFLHTAGCSVAAFLIAFLVGVLFIPIGWKLVWYCVITAGYSGVFLGFFGGIVFLMRHT